MRFFTSKFPWVKIHSIFLDKLRLFATKDNSVYGLKPVVLRWKNKITDIIISPRKRENVLFVFGLYLLSILAGLFFACLVYASEYGWQ